MKSCRAGSITLSLTKQFKLDWPRLLSKSRGIGGRDYSQIAEEMEDSSPSLGGMPDFSKLAGTDTTPSRNEQDPLKNIFGMMQKLYNSNDMMKQDISKAWAKAEEKYKTQH